MIVGFTNNDGPVELTSVQELPLPQRLNGFGGFILMQGNQYPIYPVYTLETQFTVVVDADTPPGIGNLFIDFNGSQSAAFQVTVVSSQPGFFTLSQNGRGRGIFTQNDDYSLITPTKPAQPGDVVIAWGTDASSFDDTPGVENRITGSKVRLFLGNQQLPAEDVFYYGPSAGFAAGCRRFSAFQKGL